MMNVADSYRGERAIMAQTIESMAIESFNIQPPAIEMNRPAERGIPRDFAENEFGYRPVPVLAPVTLALGLLSAVGMLGVLGLAVPLIGVILGVVCLVHIRRSEGTYGGWIPTLLGLAFSLLFLFGGTAFHAYVYATEVPEGYRRIQFADEIAAKKLIVSGGEPAIHPDVAALDGQKVYLKGFMYPTGQIEGLKSFILVKDNQQCCFGGQPELTDMILVRMADDLTATYMPMRVSVAGTFKIHDPRTGGQLQPIYELEGRRFDQSRTPF